MEGQEETLLKDKERGIRSQLLKFWSGIVGSVLRKESPGNP